MRLRLQFGGWMMALGLSAGMALPCAAQRPGANWAAQSRQDDKPPKPQRQEQSHEQQQRQAQRQERRQQQQDARRTQMERRNAEAPRRNAEPPRRRALTNPPAGPAKSLNGGDRPPIPSDRPSSIAPRNAQPGSANPRNEGNRPPNATVRPRDLSPEERRRLQPYEQRFRKLPPQQQQEMRERARVWEQMTQPQRDHVRNDVLPKWKQMPPDRQRAIRQRLGVLQNMPESARNQHLNDPNFTRGMSEEDKALLHDLSHLHVGGAPEPPSE